MAIALTYEPAEQLEPLDQSTFHRTWKMTSVDRAKHSFEVYYENQPLEQ